MSKFTNLDSPENCFRVVVQSFQCYPEDPPTDVAVYEYGVSEYCGRDEAIAILDDGIKNQSIYRIEEKKSFAAAGADGGYNEIFVAVSTTAFIELARIFSAHLRNKVLGKGGLPSYYVFSDENALVYIKGLIRRQYDVRTELELIQHESSRESIRCTYRDMTNVSFECVFDKEISSVSVKKRFQPLP